ncbi:MAG: hypothetical protein ACRDV9_08490 [Acidimicrobiia bacterium]
MDVPVDAQTSTTIPALRTDTGVHVGSAATEVRRAYPDAENRPSNFRAALRAPQGARGTLSFQFDLDFDKPIPDTALVQRIVARRNEDLDTDELCS